MASYSRLTNGLSIHLWSKLANNLDLFETGKPHDILFARHKK